MFNTSVCVNPGESVLGRGLTSWAKFGRAVTKTGMKGVDNNKSDKRQHLRKNQLKSPVLSQFLCNGDIRMRKCFKYDFRKDVNSFGVWYLHPSKWSQMENKTKSNSDASFKASDQMFEEVCELPSTKGFISFCKEKNKQEPKFLKRSKRNK